jgi:hypothetical protein
MINNKVPFSFPLILTFGLENIEKNNQMINNGCCLLFFLLSFLLVNIHLCGPGTMLGL